MLRLLWILDKATLWRKPPIRFMGNDGTLTFDETTGHSLQETTGHSLWETTGHAL